jgi:hypothetical protein
MAAGDDQSLPPKDMYTWNHFIRENMQHHVSSDVVDDWTVCLIHGFFEQKVASIFNKCFTLTLISRRSRNFAGTRYLKRGMNDRGQVANEVETEQIVHDRVGGHALDGHYTSHVQLRASVPLFWTQESSMMVARPPILVQKIDPCHYTTRLHFQNLYQRYGYPLLCLNLIKQSERTPREMILGAAFKEAVAFINHFLPSEVRIQYLAW